MREGTARAKLAFGHALEAEACLVLSTGFYEFTTEPNETVGLSHDRIPVVLSRGRRTSVARSRFYRKADAVLAVSEGRPRSVSDLDRGNQSDERRVRVIEPSA